MGILRSQATAYWQNPAIAEETAWNPDDFSQGSRRCPRMTAVYDNNRCLLILVFTLDLIVGAAWFPFFLIPVATFPITDIVGCLIMFVILAGISTVCAIATVKASRAERMMIVVGSPNVLGMNDDWPRLNEADRPLEEPIDITPQQERQEQASAARVFDFGDEALMPDDRREYG